MSKSTLFQSTHNRSFQKRDFKGNQLYWHRQPDSQPRKVYKNTKWNLNNNKQKSPVKTTYVCANDCAQQVVHTQYNTVLIIFSLILQTVFTVQMWSTTAVGSASLKHQVKESKQLQHIYSKSVLKEFCTKHNVIHKT